MFFNIFKKRKNMLNSINNSKQSVSSQLGERRMSRLSGSSCHSRRNSKISISSAHSKSRNSRISEKSKKRRTSHISSSSARRNSKISLGSKGSNSSKSAPKWRRLGVKRRGYMQKWLEKRSAPNFNPITHRPVCHP